MFDSNQTFGNFVPMYPSPLSFVGAPRTSYIQETEPRPAITQNPLVDHVEIMGQKRVLYNGKLLPEGFTGNEAALLPVFLYPGGRQLTTDEIFDATYYKAIDDYGGMPFDNPLTYDDKIPIPANPYGRTGNYHGGVATLDSNNVLQIEYHTGFNYNQVFLDTLNRRY